ncbi:diguanylate cyclase domain-containing protein [Marinospirillum perlucidum]|uniref:diguanylate cyclase domain-containing protein n=1 Tax=Marinospirillum perlucidum TaxID=1982602 RepID=UPI000DF145E7|nr:diguanylate cyclase [Marinospirillum perlucidum]
MAKDSFYQEIIEQGIPLIWVAGPDKQRFYFNQSWLNFTGRKLEEEQGQGWIDSLHPEDSPTCLEDYYHAFDQREACSRVYRLLRQDGEYRWIQEDTSPRFTASGDFQGYIGYCLDITRHQRSQLKELHRRQLLQALTAGEELHRLLQTQVHYLSQVYPHLEARFSLYANEPALPWQPGPPLRLFFQAGRDQGGSCWSEPLITTSGEALGALSVHCRSPKRPGEEELKVIQDEARFATLMIEKKQAETAMQLSARVFAQASEAIMITDTRGRIIQINQAFTDTTGFTASEVLGKTPRCLKSEKHPPGFYQQIWAQLASQGSWQGEIWKRRKDGSHYPSICNISRVRGDQKEPSHYVALFSDISLIKEHQRHLEILAHYDALTQLPNRTLLTDRLELARAQCQRRRESLAVGFIDLDGFKAVNDSHSHALGDQLLVAITRRFSQLLRDSDTLARLGGDEFILILTDLKQPQDYQRVLDRLLQAAAEPLNLNGQKVQISASIGVTLYPQDHGTTDELIRHADLAMYTAKQAGKNCYRLYQPESG